MYKNIINCSFKFPKLEKCCCCIKISTGSVILGTLLLIQQVYNIVWDLLKLMEASRNTEPLYGYILNFAGHSIFFFSVFLLMIGILFHLPKLMLPTLWPYGIFLVILCCFGIPWAFIISWQLGVYAILFEAVNIYFWLCMQTAYRKLKEKEGELIV